MSEKTKTLTESQGPASGSGIFDEPDDQGGLVSVTSGLHSRLIPVAGMSIGEIRHRFADHFELAPGSTGVVDGEEVGDDTVVRSGQKVMFTHLNGIKGRAAMPAARAA